MSLDFREKKVLVLGAGISGIAVAKTAYVLGADVCLSDAKSEIDLEKYKSDFEDLREFGIKIKFEKQEESLLDGVSYLIVSPVIPVRVPIVQAAYKRGIRVLSEVELAYRLAKSPLAAVTGTNGKTTTVTLLGLLLKEHFGEEKTGVGGNIGVPLVEEVMRVGAGGAIAAEISSYQMEATEAFHPHVAAILNVTPDHIVRHGTMDVYRKMKEKLFAQQLAGDVVVLNYDDKIVRDMANRIPVGVKVCYFSRQNNLDEGVCLVDDMLTIKWEGKQYKLCTTIELGIKGVHNIENAMAASACAFFMGVLPSEMREVLTSFQGVEHRIEYVRTVNDVLYYNDSKATNTDSAIKALETFSAHIILIAGGDDKLTDLTEFIDYVKKSCDELVLLGDAAERFSAEAIKNGYPEKHIHMVGHSMEDAVAKVHSLAHKGQIVLLSPACASFDMYSGFEERGRDFKRLVNEI